ncbi:LysR family transcriptional regulator [Pseudorhodoplanes sp.]|jgi:DNA-binding transcriptional LysR family regulator|uniref:LysR family transcriptional regulator n=1 Tax=Pseudorhodoplanes sp. TaxID=1934341 RepID=UPI002D167ABE|nr:LysR substrate-binding domain-containing protein [Pseudorhodoplanes sp.]HWV41770.1 LysR substrate-binding domain-containing protein [Pseudorhodoplanes sp.]
MNITLRQIQAFKTVAEFGSFTRAAERLKVAQPALSLSIRELERELNLRLFDRTTRRVELTGAGREFLQSADKLLADLERAVREARDLSEKKRGRVVVAAPPLLAAMIVPSAIADFNAAFPGIDVGLVDARNDQILDRLRAGAADLAIGTFDERADGIRREMLAQDALTVFCAPASPLAKKRRVRWTDLHDQKLIMLTRDSSIRTLTERTLTQSGHDAGRPLYEVSQMTTAIMLVEAGLGAAVLPAYVWSFARGRDVVSRPLVEPQVSRAIYLIHPDGRSLSPAAESFARTLRKQTRTAIAKVVAR